ncbi:hypothetical protein PRIPAC_71444 [Pristionchus pacificus]|uniref:Uncharacterized protein n=1 Tax=Pristionchus pacificus TaxID=54126 RepID=A0A2A6D092_PRIPA|nr:hypothetical protein PRIPAC_71444 [Pristionchus pacificus]|eukprot:PDM83701.1 hypothetical protein PRIPAC_30188 [Pristionchus pacificus]
MSRFVAMFQKLAAEVETSSPSPSDVSFSSRVLLHESRRPFTSSSSSIDHSDFLRKNLLRSKIIQRANNIMDLDRISSSSHWSLPSPSLSFSLDGCTGGVETNHEDDQSIVSNNEALDQLFDDIFSSSSPSSLSPFDVEDSHLFCSKQAKIRKVDGYQSFSHHWDSQLFLPVY